MQDNDDGSWLDDDILPRPTPKDLRGRQSVRATFKLSAKAIETMSIVAVHLGIKQKSLFDHLIEDVQSLKLIAREVESERFNAISRIQKTFVISRRTLSYLDETSKRFNAPRDALAVLDVGSIELLAIEIARHRHFQRVVTTDPSPRTTA